MGRKRKINKTVLRLSLVILALLLGGGAFALYKFPIAIGAGKTVELGSTPDLTTVLSGKEVYEDALQMVKFLEDVHPAFLEKKTAEYEECKRLFLAGAQKEMSVGSFRLLVGKYLSSLRDGHTHLFWDDDSELKVSWRWENNRLYIVSGDGLPQGAEVTAIGGVPVQAIMENIAAFFPAENHSAEIRNNSQYSKCRSILEASGVDVKEPIELDLENRGEPAKAEVTFAVRNEEADQEEQSEPFIKSQSKGKALIITLRSCELGTALDRSIEDIKKSLTEGTNKVIIDVRDNPGGNSLACSKLLRALGMEEGQYGSVIRFSPEASEQRGYIRTSGSVIFKPDNQAKPNKRIDLYVLVNRNTFSSANMLAVWVQDGKLGKIAGQSPANAPSSYGDILYFKLKNSGLFGTVSHKKWTRPDTAKDEQTELIPDIPVPEDGDALAAVL